MKLTKELDHPREGLISVETFTKLKKKNSISITVFDYEKK